MKLRGLRTGRREIRTPEAAPADEPALAAV